MKEPRNLSSNIGRLTAWESTRAPATRHAEKSGRVDEHWNSNRDCRNGGGEAVDEHLNSNRNHKEGDIEHDEMSVEEMKRY